MSRIGRASPDSEERVIYKMKCEPCGYRLESSYFNVLKQAMQSHFFGKHVLYGNEEIREEGSSSERIGWEAS